MKKSGLIDGAVIATLAIVISKILGLVYVVPFYSIIGEEGGALYGYAYNIYNIFLIISAAGIPFAVSKITSEFIAKDKLKEKEYMYKFSGKFIIIFSIITFLTCFIGAESFANLILGDMNGGNTISDVTFVIRCVSFALLIAPTLSIFRGYLQGHKYIAASSFSQVIEQIFRIIIIIVGSYLAMNVFDLPLRYAVGIAVIAAGAGALVGFFYLLFKTKKIEKYKEEINISKKEKKSIQKKLISYAVPFILVNLAFYLYSSVDMILIIRTLDHLGYAATDIEQISSIFTTWGAKLITVVTSIGAGLVISLIPSMVTAFAKKEKEEVNRQYGKAFEVLLYIIMPISLFLSIHADDVWNVFYGNSFFGPIVFRYLAILAFFDSMYLILGCILQNLNKNKLIYTTILLGLGLNAALDIPLMLLFENFGYPYYGAITATLIGYTTSSLYVMYKLKKDDKISYESKKILKSIIRNIIIILPINIIFSFIAKDVYGRIADFVFLGGFAVISLGIYIILNKNILNSLFGGKFARKLLKKK